MQVVLLVLFLLENILKGSMVRKSGLTIFRKCMIALYLVI